MTNRFDIFISYRREGSEVAKHIKGLLIRNGYYVSFDMDNLMNGDFNKELPEALKRDKNGRYLGYDLQIK